MEPFYDRLEQKMVNVQVIPANDGIRAKLQWVRPGHLIQVKGYLMRVTGPNGSVWQRSINQNGTGDGACKTLLVESFDIIR